MDSHGSPRISADLRVEVRRRLAAAGLDPATEQDVVEELAQHLDDRYRELRAEGLTRDEARDAILRELDANELLGRDVGDLKARRTSSNSLEPVRTPSNHLEPSRTCSNLLEPARMFSNLLQDVRFGLRLMRKTPVFTTVAALTMAVCIGANVALFSVVDVLLLRPLDYPRSDRVVRIFEHIVDANLLRNGAAGPNILDWKEQSTVFTAIAAYRRRNVNISGYARATAGPRHSSKSEGGSGHGEPRYVRAARVTGVLRCPRDSAGARQRVHARRRSSGRARDATRPWVLAVRARVGP